MSPGHVPQLLVGYLTMAVAFPTPIASKYAMLTAAALVTST
jgi:hypothetical protein